MSTVTRPTAPWSDVVDRADLGYREVERLLSAFEAARAQYDDAVPAAAQHLRTLAGDRGWEPLERRAALVLADHAAREGDLGPASVLTREVLAWAVRHENTYLEARCAFVLATIAFSIGDSPTTLVEGLRGVQLLPDDAPAGVRIDHLLIAAVGHGPGTPEGERLSADVLELALAEGDLSAALVIHNNEAWAHYLAGKAADALTHVDQMLELERRGGEPLKAIFLDTIARVQVLHGDLPAALRTLEPVLAGRPGLVLGVPSGRVDCLLAAASIHRRLGDYATAARLLDRAAGEASEKHLLAALAAALEERAIWHAAQGDFAAAFAHYVEFHRTSDQVRTEEAARHAHLVHAAYEVEQAGRDALRYRELAYRDGLTGLYNRRHLDEALPRLCRRARDEGTAVSVAIVDADHFKRINDELSHETGDEVLRVLARLLQEHAGTDAVVGRLGGEEFALLLGGISAEAALDRCEQVRKAVQAHAWAATTGDVPVTVSIGVTTAEASRTSPGALLSDADRNLYAAKRSGRNRVMGDPQRGQDGA